MISALRSSVVRVILVTRFAFAPHSSRRGALGLHGQVKHRACGPGEPRRDLLSEFCDPDPIHDVRVPRARPSMGAQPVSAPERGALDSPPASASLRPARTQQAPCCQGPFRSCCSVLWSRIEALADPSGVRTDAQTSGLTKSFGWSAAEAFQQHDAQEFVRVLIDALERSTPERTVRRGRREHGRGP